jgi:CheY-like chemotaxis protein
MIRNFSCAIVADDCSPTNMLVRMSLKTMGIETIYEASNGIECLNLLREHASEQPVIIMDWQMPLLDGLACTELIRNGTVDGAPTDTPIIILTGDQDGFREVRNLPKIDYLMYKPFTLEKLHQAFNAIAYCYLSGELRYPPSTEPQVAVECR